MSALLEHADKLRAHADIVDVVGRYVTLRPGGVNQKGLCPFHREKSPSFTVSPAKQIFHCFGCHEGGDVIRFVQKVERLEWIEAVRLLSQQYGLTMPESRRSAAGTEVHQDQRQKLLAASQYALEFFAAQLRRDAAEPRHEIGAYLQRRSLPAELVERFQLGLAPDAWGELLEKATKAGHTRETLVDAGLVIHNPNSGRHYDRFRKRLVFPIHDPMGRPIAFGARTYASDAAPDEPKYVNSPESPLYHKGQALYALHLARETITREGKALVMEGYMDVMRAHQYGFTNAVATCGTAITDEQCRVLKRFCSHAVFIYDGDAAGQKAMARGAEILLEQGFTLSIVSLPDGHDPDSYLVAHGAPAFGEEIARAKNFLDHFLAQAAERFDRRSPDGKVQIVEAVLPLLKRVGKSIAQNEYVRKTADFVGIDPSLVLRQLSDANPRSLEKLREAVEEQNRAAESRLESTLLRLVVESPPARAKVLQRLQIDWLQNSSIKKWFTFLQSEGAENITWDLLLQAAADEAEAAFLRMLALSEEPFDAGDRTLDNVLARLERNYLRTYTSLIAEKLQEFYASAPDQLNNFEDLVKSADGTVRPVKELGQKYFLKQAGR